MRDGKLDRGQIQAWALNRYYYQARIPAKDAFLVARLPTPTLRREWRRRILDHDRGDEATGGGAPVGTADRGVPLPPACTISAPGRLPPAPFSSRTVIR